MADKDISFLKPEQSIALNRYTYKVDGHINNYLRNGKQTYIDYLNSLGDHSFYNVKLLLCVPENLDKTESIEYMVKKIKEYIHEIQEAFQSANKTTKNNKLELYRGTKGSISHGIIKGFLSTTISENIASRFMKMPEIPQDDEEDAITCCMYKYILDEGIPYIYLESLTESKGEEEVLLPDNLYATLIREYVDDYSTQIYEVRLSLKPLVGGKRKTMKRKQKLKK